MTETIRVATAVFKGNPRPFVQRAKEGVDVIVTNEGQDDFRVVPVLHQGPPPVSSTPLDPAQFAEVDVNEPAFAPWR